CAVPGVGPLTGFENHRGITTLGVGVSPLGRVVTGTGNGTRDGMRRRTEGVLTDRVVGTYLHGPVLARNPALADHILHKVTGRFMPPIELPDQIALRHTYLRSRK
ncbi:MAG: glutamine amidotransferase, partial [Pseudonocardiaceae bacterium]